MSKELCEFCWNELLSTDPQVDKAFYTQQFGWEAVDKELSMGTYTLFRKNGKEIAGMMKMPHQTPASASYWLAYVTVADVDQAIKEATENKAQVRVPAMDIPQIGRLAIIASPTGALIGFYTPDMT